MTSFRMAMLVCRDLARSRAFYATVVGLKVGHDASPHWIELELGGGALLRLHAVGSDLVVRPGSLQLGFWVPDVDRFVSDARVSGVTILQEPYDERASRVCVIADPDGYPVQVGSAKR